MAWLTKKSRVFNGKIYNLLRSTTGKPVFCETEYEAKRVVEIQRNRGILAEAFNDPVDGWLVYTRKK